PAEEWRARGGRRRFALDTPGSPQSTQSAARSGLFVAVNQLLPRSHPLVLSTHYVSTYDRDEPSDSCIGNNIKNDEQCERNHFPLERHLFRTHQENRCWPRNKKHKGRRL